MTPAVAGRGDVIEEQRLERQMGCMAGFFQLFDRHHIVTGRRSFSTRRLPASSSAGSTSPSERSEVSSASQLLYKESHSPPPSSPEPCPSSKGCSAAAETPGRRSLPLPLQVFEATDGGGTSWRIRDGPRFSLDSRVVVDARGKLRPREIRTAVSIASESHSDASEVTEEQRRSPSVVARLMGLNGLPSDGRANVPEPERAELRRSSSESRVRNNRSSYGFIDAGSFRKLSPPLEPAPVNAEEFFKSVSLAQLKLNNTGTAKQSSRTAQMPPLQRKIYFDAEDFFPEPKRSTSLYSEIEKRIRMRGIEEPAKDMETVRQILEALQLKGLLRSNTSHHIVNNRRNLIYDCQTRPQTDAPIVIMKPSPKSPRRPLSESPPLPPRTGNGCQSPPPVRRGLVGIDRSVRGGNEQRIRSPRSPDSRSSPVNRRQQNPAAQKSAQPQRRISTVGSPKSSPKRSGPDPLAVRSPRNRKPSQAVSSRAKLYALAEDDTTSTTFSESSVSSSSQLECERSNVEYSSDRSLLERCDKLLNTIAAFTGPEQVTAADQQPSPVSVLDSLSFLAEGSPSPSSLAKRSIDFNDKSTDDWEYSEWSPPASTIGCDAESGPDEAHRDFAYVSEVVRACDRYGDASHAVYAILEKRRGVDACKAARLHRRLVFDTVAEILDQKRRVPLWDAFSRPATASSEEDLLRHVWSELRRIGEPEAADADDEEVGGAMRKDINGGRPDGWVRASAEMSDAVVHIERLIFKDLVAETIRDLTSATADARRLLPRRKLHF